MKDSTVPGIVSNSSSLKDAPQIKPEPKGFKGLILLFKEIWSDMNRPLTEEEQKEYNEFLKSNPYSYFNNPFSPYSRSDFNNFL